MPAIKGARAALIVIVPTVIASIVGLLLAIGIRSAGRALSSPLLEGNPVFAVVILSSAFTGFMVGIKTRMRVLAQMALDEKSGKSPSEQEDESLV